MKDAGKWINVGKMMFINLESAREQYTAFGYPHRNILRKQCSNCKKVTMVDETIMYKFCPHCGTQMESEE